VVVFPQRLSRFAIAPSGENQQKKGQANSCARAGWMEEIIMETLLIVIMLFIVLDIASLRWGFDSTDKINSPEWKRRQEWGGII
jgi:hypothetical protein